MIVPIHPQLYEFYSDEHVLLKAQAKKLVQTLNFPFFVMKGIHSTEKMSSLSYSFVGDAGVVKVS